MGSLGLPARAMAVRSAFALLCFALLCGLAVSSVVQPETETELTKKEDEAAGNEVLVEQAVESRVVRGTGKKNCKKIQKNVNLKRNADSKGGHGRGENARGAKEGEGGQRIKKQEQLVKLKESHGSGTKKTENAIAQRTCVKERENVWSCR